MARVPSVQSGVIDIDATFFHDLFEILIGNRVAKVKENRKKNDILRVVFAFEADHQPIQAREIYFKPA